MPVSWLAIFSLDTSSSRPPWKPKVRRAWKQVDEIIPTWWFKVTFLGWFSDPYKGLGDLQLGDEKVTLNFLVLKNHGLFGSADQRHDRLGPGKWYLWPFPPRAKNLNETLRPLIIIGFITLTEKYRTSMERDEQMNIHLSESLSFLCVLVVFWWYFLLTFTDLARETRIETWKKPWYPGIWGILLPSYMGII